MTQVTDFSAEEVTFRWLQFQAVLHESLQHGAEAHQVFLLSLGVNDHVVQISRAYVRFSSPKQFCMRCWNVAGALHNP